MKTLRLIPIFVIFPTALFSQVAKDGDVLITTTEVVNEYTALSQDANPGDMDITVLNAGLNTNGNFTSPLEAGDLIMIIQMQGATIKGNVNDITWGEILSYNACGLYEFKEVAAVPNATHIELVCPVENSYDQSGNVQVIRVPRYNTLTVNGGTITALNWNGIFGGVVAIEVNGLTTLINGGKIDVTGQGFRGGIMDNSSSYGAMDFAYNNQNAGGEKGESIAGFGPEYAPLGGRYGRGAPANGGGGGNAHNAGGGGGANAGNEIPWNGLGNPDNTMPGWTTAWNQEALGFSGNLSSGGGRGGYTFSASNQNALILGPMQGGWGGDNRRNTGGIGGRPLDYSGGRIFLGGGGGAGDGNNGAGTNGANGGGLVYLLTYDNVVGNGQIVASGQTAPVTPPNGNDAPGGGGGGGTIVVNTNGTIATTISLIANGGKGGDQFILTNEAEGPGGGGGGGYIAYSNGTPLTNVAGGGNGITNSLGMTEFIPNGATRGGAGMISTPITGLFNMQVIAMDDSVCIGNTATLSASAEDPAFNNDIHWYDSPIGGNLLATGATYTTPPLFVNTTYYLKVCPSLTLDSVTVYVQPNPVFTVMPDSVSCFAGSDGFAEVSSSELNTYLWSNGQTGNTATGLSAGLHSVTAASSFGCTTTLPFNVDQPLPIQIALNETPAPCFGEPGGSLEALASGGTGTLNYFWPTAAVNGATLANLSNGVYPVIVTDINGCSDTVNGIVTSPPPLVVTINAIQNVSCFNGDDGSVLVNIQGGSAPYVIDWLSLADDAVYMDNLSAGNYVAEVTDINNCDASVVATISEPMPFSVDLVIIEEETCSASNGVAFAGVTGGIGVIDYSWTPNVSSTNLATNLSAGPIQVIVQDENGCVSTDTENLINHATGTATVLAQNPVSCENGSDGSVEVEMLGGTAPFIYDWSCACPNTSLLTNLAAGVYQLIVTDDYGCVSLLDVTIDETPALVLSMASSQDPLCFGGSDGQAEVQAAGGTGPFFFSWNTMPAQYNSTATNLSAGSYSAIVTDANNCQDTISIVIDQPSALVVQTTVLSNILCHGDSAGVMAAVANGGVGPYNYNWNTGSTSDTLTGIPSGTYTVNVTDAHGCSIQSTNAIEEYQHVTAQLIGDTIFCPGDLVTFTVLTNGMNNLYDYNWFVNGNLQSTQNTYTIPVMAETEISFELVHAANCPSLSDTLVVSPIQLNPAILAVEGTQDTLCQGSPGFIQAFISDWSFLTSVSWENETMNGVGPHIVKPDSNQYYVITVENMCHQTIQDSVWLQVFMPPFVEINAQDTASCEVVEAQFGFHYDAYDYSLTGVNWSIHAENYNVADPIVSFDVSADVWAGLELSFSNGCSFTYHELIQMVVYPAPEADFYYNPNPAMQGELTEFIDISNGNPVAWEWYTENQFISNDERPTWTFNEQGNFAVMQVIVNEYGCSDTSHHVVEVIGDFLVFVPNAFTPDGNDYNNFFQPVFQNVKPDNYDFLIFNRWGEMIFEAHDLDAAWDGVYAGDLVKDDVYVWVIRVTDNRDIEHEYRGHVTLLK